MKTKLALVAAAAALFTAGAFAQAPATKASAPKGPAADQGPVIKGEAQDPAAATKAGTPSTRSRAERKETTKAEAKAGQLAPSGEAASK